MKQRYWLALATILVALILIVTVLGATATAASPDSDAVLALAIVINESDADTAGTDAEEFVELYDGGSGNIPLDGLVLVFFNGNGDVSYRAEDLDGYSTDANGYFVAGNAAVSGVDLVFPINILQNGADAIGLYTGDAADFPNGTAVTNTNLLDAIVYDTDEADDTVLLSFLLNLDQPQVNENGAGNKDYHSNQRCPNGSGGERNTDTYLQNLPTPGTVNLCSARVAIDKVVEPDKDVTPGSTVTYTVAVDNSSSFAASGVVLTDTLPAEADFTAWVISPTGTSLSNDEINWTGDLSVGEALEWVFTAEVTGSLGSTVVNTATVNLDGELSDAEAGFGFSSPSIDINEIRIDQPSSDYDEYFELAGSAGTSLDGLTYLVIGDGTGGSGVIEAVVDLSGNLIPASGFFVAAEGTFGLGTADLTANLEFENSDNVTHLLVNGFTGSSEDDLDTDDDGVLDVSPWSSILDCVAMIESVGSGDQTYCSTTVGPDGSFVPGHAYRCWDWWAIGQFDPLDGGDTPGTANQCLVINEIIQNPDAVYDSAGEWLELFNTTDTDIDIDGWTIEDDDDDSHVINNGGPLYVPAGGYLVLGNNADSGTNGGVTVAYSYGGALALGNSADEVVLLDASLEEIDRVEYDGGTNWPDPTGASMSLEMPGLDNNVGANWCTATTAFGDGDLGTPGAENVCEIPPDLELSKAVSPYMAAEGDTITYTLEVANNTAGTAGATNVVIKDYLPHTTTQVIYITNTCGATIDSGVVTWDVGDMAAGYSASCDIAVEIRVGTDGTHLDNFAEVFASDQPDADSTPGNMGEAPAEDDEDGAIVWIGTDPECGTAATYIHTIQGSGTSSPEDGNTHTIEGVVVGDYQDTDVGLGGFFLQEEDADADLDPTTSEGIFVDASGFGATVYAGDLVRVTGRVDEYYDLTELTGVTTVTLCSMGNSVTPATVTLPISDTAEWEWVEGSLVTIPGELYVTENYNLGRYGEVMLSVNDRLYNPTNVVMPGTEANDLQDLNDRSYVVLDDANPNQNADPVIYPSPELSATNTLRSGDTLPDLTAVVDYAYGIYRMQPVGPITFTAANERTAAPDPIDSASVFTGTLKVASFNVLNYFVTIDTGAAICGPTGGMDCRGANSAEEFTRQRTKIINAIIAMDADVIGLMEMENHPTDDALLDLVAGLNAEAGAGTYARIVTGTIGTDAIKVAFIYKTGTVTPVGSPAILDSSVDPTFIDTKNRPVLAQTFMETATGELFTAAVNHLKSKGSDCDDIGDPDTGDGQGNCNLTRTSAAIAMVNWLATDPTGSGDPDTLIIGDLNSYAMEDPIMALQDGGYTNLLSAHVGPDAYSYIFDGQAGYLDHALASINMNLQVTGATIWHINTDEPMVLDYNTEYKSPGQVISFYSDFPYRASDHDPVIVGLNLSVRPIYLPLVMRN